MGVRLEAVAARLKGPRPAAAKISRFAAAMSAADSFAQPTAMALIVHKYGGTSMGSPERIAMLPSAWPSGCAQAIRWWWFPQR